MHVFLCNLPHILCSKCLFHCAVPMLCAPHPALPLLAIPRLRNRRCQFEWDGWRCVCWHMCMCMNASMSMRMWCTNMPVAQRGRATKRNGTRDNARRPYFISLNYNLWSMKNSNKTSYIVHWIYLSDGRFFTSRLFSVADNQPTWITLEGTIKKMISR